MPHGLKRYYGRQDLHFITSSCYRRRPALGNPSFRTLFVRCLERVRARRSFALLGYVVMPEHFHLLISEPYRGTPSTVMQVLKQSVSREILKELRRATAGTPAHQLLAQLIVSTRSGKARLWQRRFYDFNVWSEKKKWEKLEYMHLNPVERKLVKHPGHWPWSSFCYYAYGDTKMLAMDPWPPPVG
ncbi:MAG: transposase [Acidobacteria bacterium]|nr:transposase [Acidobacteriota bacterium]